MKSAAELRLAARHAALQAIYALDCEEGELEEVLAYALEQESFPEVLAQYITTLVKATVEDGARLDGMISPLMAQGWRFERLAKVDRAILRMAAAEFEHIPQTPPKVTINESVELAKLFGDQNSPPFINGVLGRLLPLSVKSSYKHEAFDPMLAEPVARVISDEDGEEIVEAGSVLHEELSNSPGWTIRTP